MWLIMEIHIVLNDVTEWALSVAPRLALLHRDTLVCIFHERQRQLLRERILKLEYIRASGISYLHAQHVCPSRVALA